MVKIATHGKQTSPGILSAYIIYCALALFTSVRNASWYLYSRLRSVCYVIFSGLCWFLFKKTYCDHFLDTDNSPEFVNEHVPSLLQNTSPVSHGP